MSFSDRFIYDLIFSLTRHFVDGVSAGFSRSDILNMKMKEAIYYKNKLDEFLEQIKEHNEKMKNKK